MADRREPPRLDAVRSSVEPPPPIDLDGTRPSGHVRSAQPMELQMPTAVSPLIQFVELSTNVRLEYVEQGDPAGVPVICLHGSTDSWHSFEPVLPLLPASLHVFSLTQRGHGDSDRPESGYRLRD